MEVAFVTEADINSRLSELKGKVPTVVINDLREKLIARKDQLTPGQLDKIIKKVLEAYGNQASKYEQLNRRVDELGKRLSDLGMQLSRLLESLEETKFKVHEKRAEEISEKAEEVHERIEKLEEILEEKEETIPDETKKKLEELHKKIEELEARLTGKVAMEMIEEAKSKVEELEQKLESGEGISAEELEEAIEKVEAAEAGAEAAVEEKEATPEEVVEEVPEEAVEEVKAPEEVVEKVEEAPVEVPVYEEVKTPSEEVKEVAPSPEVEEEKVEEGGVEMTEGKLQIPEDIASLLFAEEPRKARLEKLPEDVVSTMIALKWLGFLIDRVGIQNLERVLEFYYEIGWISEDVLNQLLRYAKGTRPHHRDPEWKPAEKLTVQDHLISLLFIERLRGLRINRDVLDKLEREIKLLEKTLDEFYGI
ncbi:FlaD/FlaE family flagellar protein [Thermococcus zilligii]|uniref:FlaD/FlaE family flagellar protein n=1 Tax=Thermococcus zilligii TaxID=54076 RepID=UPI00029B0BF8|nr:FlaD/FlaE family flagellar protein [Thermococcus zilligii]